MDAAFVEAWRATCRLVVLIDGFHPEESGAVPGPRETRLAGTGGGCTTNVTEPAPKMARDRPGVRHYR